jgi:hypothetical protein
MQYAEDSAYQDTYSINDEQLLNLMFGTVGTGTLNTTASEEHYSGDTTATIYTELHKESMKASCLVRRVMPVLPNKMSVLI